MTLPSDFLDQATVKNSLDGDEDGGVATGVGRIAVLQTGLPPANLDQGFGGYPQMLSSLLADRRRSFQSYDVTVGQYPAAGDFDALLITGSSAAVYEPHAWIGPLKDFVLANKGRRMVGVCFGHQLMAEVFGGKVERSKNGWGIGLHRYRVGQPVWWMDGLASFSIAASHQDQVVSQPPNTVVTATSSFTPIAGLAYTDHPAISFQGHPEFEPAFAKALIEVGRAARHFPGSEADQAVASLCRSNDRQAVANWIGRFLDQAQQPDAHF